MQGTEFQTITVKVGTADAQADYRRSKRFSGRELASVRTYEGARSRDDRGKDYTLYERPDGSYLVHVFVWTRWQGESDDSELIPIATREELAEQFPAVANAAGIEVIEDLE